MIAEFEKRRPPITVFEIGEAINVAADCGAEDTNLDIVWS